MARPLPAEMMALREAAILAHGKLFARNLQMSDDALDMIATSLSGHVHVYGVRRANDPWSELTEDDYSHGAFRGGAARFEFREGGAPIVGLAIVKSV